MAATAIAIAARFVRRASLRPILLLALVLAACPGRAAAADWEPIPAEAWQEPARPDSGGGDAITLLDRSECRDLEGSFQYDYFGRVKIFTAQGRDFGTIEIPYPKGRWTLSDVRARSVRPDGRVTEFDPAKLLETTDFRYGDWNLVHATIVVPGVEPGVIVEWAYRFTGTAGERGGWRFRFDNRLYTCLSSHTWYSSTWWKDELKRSWRISGIVPVLVDQHCTPDCDRAQSVTFTLRNQVGVRNEELAPPAIDAAPHVTVFYSASTSTDYWSGWKSLFDRWQHEVGQKTGALDDLVKQFRAQHADPESSLADAYRWVQSHVHSVDELPWERRPAEGKRPKYRFAGSLGELMGRSEVSPFEINALMVAIARQLGLTAAVGFVGDRRFQTFDSQVLGFPPSNTVTVVNSPSRRRPVFLDPSSRFTPYGSVPWYDCGGQCLLSGETSDLFMRVPPSESAPGEAEWRVRAKLGADGGIDGRVDAHLREGEAADWRRGLWSEDPARWPGVLKDRIGAHDGPEVTFETPSVDAPSDSELALHATAHWPGIAAVAGDRITVPLDRLLAWRTQARLQPAFRKQPVLLRYPRVETIRADLALAPGLSVARLPDPLRFQNDLGSWSITWSQSEGAVSVERKLDLKWAEIPPQGYAAAREFFQSLDRADQSVLLVTRTP